MATSRVVVADVALNLLSGDQFVFEGLHFQLRLDRPKAGLHERVVVAVVSTAHALPHASTAKTGGNRSSRSRALGSEIPIGEVSAVRAGADQRIAGAAIVTHRRLTKEHVGRIISRIGEEAKIIVQHEDPQTGRRRKYASAHDLRRGCAQRLINAGVSAETLKVLLRHEDFATTEKFYGATRAAQSAAAEIYEKLGKTGAEDALVGGFVGGNQQHLRLTDEELRKLKNLLARL